MAQTLDAPAAPSMSDLRAVLSAATEPNLQGRDLSGLDLRGASFVGANLSNTNLAGTNLAGANLGQTNLADALGVDRATFEDASLSARWTSPDGTHVLGNDIPKVATSAPPAPVQVTIYTKPRCFKCDATKRLLDQLGIRYTAVDITEAPVVLEALKAQGFAEAPVIDTGTDLWSGFRPERLRTLAEEKSRPVDKTIATPKPSETTAPGRSTSKRSGPHR